MAFKFNFTKEHLEDILKGNKEIDAWYKTISQILPKYDIDTPERVAGFLAQCGHESVNFTRLEENLNYSADGLNKIFPKYFQRAGRDAKEYHRQPEKIANVVYGGRMGNNSPGDGWRYRGRGPLQLTGHDNYAAFGKTLNKSASQVAEYMSTRGGALESAAWFWKTNNLNSYCDKGDIVGMTKRINGGTIGLEDRKKHYEHSIEVLSGKAIATAAPKASVIKAAPKASVIKNAMATVRGTVLRTTVKKGSRGAVVKLVQEALGVTADGSFGPNTEAALIAWQESKQLTADGIAGPKTLGLLLD